LHRFGRRAKKLPEEQLLLGLEEVEQTIASDEQDAGNADPSARTIRAARCRQNRRALPAHLPRIEVTVDIEARHGALHRIGEDVGERLETVPAQVRVSVVRRPK